MRTKYSKCVATRRVWCNLYLDLVWWGLGLDCVFCFRHLVINSLLRLGPLYVEISVELKPDEH